ncbi:right-handed parallel beta-helix repeat-containing protein [Arthrobacter sp. ISL-48]|uniref:Ig-like domain-containing protein n=1 Tax=Arthrobacter sp. ISL-48 TaxID=2819110 RepID=UPI001BE8199B|nr:Ig-like domain-containing protein [Arthrobacter sp. ISL-48]MBT2534464.1 right-handed parallel beta-helix repeat-containing protein [Arthrobacter sp. ISL-48]
MKFLIRQCVTTGSLLMVLLSALVAFSPAATAATTSLYASPTGSGTVCTQAAPCQLTAALGKAASGDRVQLVSGNYAKVTLPAQAGLVADFLARTPENIVIEPAAGAAVSIAGLDTYASAHTWRNLTFTDSVMVRQASVRVKLDMIHVNGSGAYIRGQKVEVTNSLFENGVSTDGLQIGQAKGVLVQGNTIRNYTQTSFDGFHSDCIQMFDASDVVIRGNFLSNCYNSGIIFSPGMGWGTHDVLVESNFVQGCVAAFCTGGVTLDMGTTTENTNFTLRNNTFIGDSAKVGTLPGLVFDRNIVGYLSNCDSPMTNTIVMSWNKGLCAQPASVGHNGTRIGQVNFVNGPAGDFHLTDGLQARIDGAGSLIPAPNDYDGSVTALLTAGADSAPVAIVVPPADTVSPVVNVTSPASGATVSGLVTLKAQASDNVGVTAVSFWADTLRLADATRQADGTWAATLDSRKYANMQVSVRAKAVDAAGNIATSAGTTFRIAN